MSVSRWRWCLADSHEIGEDALQEIELDIDPLPAVVTCMQSLKGDVKLIDDAESNVAALFYGEKGDVEAAFKAAHFVQKGHFYTQRQTALPMECRGLLAEWDEDTEYALCFREPQNSRSSIAGPWPR